MDQESYDLGWVTAFFDAEGCIWVDKHPERYGARYRVHLNVTNTDVGVMRHFQRVVGVGRIRKLKPRGSRKALWQWQVTSADDVTHVLTMLYPGLSARRRMKARQAFEAISLAKYRWAKKSPDQQQ